MSAQGEAAKTRMSISAGDGKEIEFALCDDLDSGRRVISVTAADGAAVVEMDISLAQARKLGEWLAPSPAATVAGGVALVETDCSCRYPGSLGGDCDGSCTATGTPGRVLQKAPSVPADARVREVLDILFDRPHSSSERDVFAVVSGIDQLVATGQLRVLDLIMKALSPFSLSAEFTLALLRVSFRVRHSLSEWRMFRSSARAAFIADGKDAERLLVGLLDDKALLSEVKP